MLQPMIDEGRKEWSLYVLLSEWCCVKESEAEGKANSKIRKLRVRKKPVLVGRGQNTHSQQRLIPRMQNNEKEM